MLLRPECLVTIQFAANNTYPSRSGSVTFHFVEELDVVSSWRILGDTCKFKMPRSGSNGVSTIYAYDQNGKIYDYVKGIASVPERADGTVDPNAWPLVMRGDRVTIQTGYRYPTGESTSLNSSGQDTITGSPSGEQLTMNTIFQGWVTKVINRIPIEIDCMDDMFKFQQYFVPNKIYSLRDTVESIVQDLLYGYNQQISGLDTPVYYKPAPNSVKTTTNAVFRTQNETLAQALARLRKEVAFESWLRPASGSVMPQPIVKPGVNNPGIPATYSSTINSLHSSPIQYWPDNGDGTESANVTLVFQRNIITDDLQYTRIDDVNMGAVAYSFQSSQVAGKISKTTGQPPTKKARYEVFVGFKNGKKFATVLAAGTPPQNLSKTFYGEFKTYYFWDKNSTGDLINAAQAQLQKFAYAGWRGTLTTFGLPLVKHGDQLQLIDNILPERTGQYFVRAVTTTYGVHGYRQKIELDIRIDGNTGTPQPWNLPDAPSK